MSAEQVIEELKALSSDEQAEVLKKTLPGLPHAGSENCRAAAAPTGKP